MKTGKKAKEQQEKMRKIKEKIKKSEDDDREWKNKNLKEKKAV